MSNAMQASGIPHRGTKSQPRNGPAESGSRTNQINTGTVRAADARTRVFGPTRTFIYLDPGGDSTGCFTRDLSRMR